MPEVTHGVSTKGFSDMEKTLKDKTTDPSKAIINDIKERIYASRTTQPLGARQDRKYQFPEEVSQNPDFRFGSATINSKIRFELDQPIGSHCPLNQNR